MKVYRQIARSFDAFLNCVKSGNNEWEIKHAERINELIKNYCPHGSGIDNGVHFDWDKSTKNKLVFNTSFHHMDENGFYTGWTDHIITLIPDLALGFKLKISGLNRNEIKEYLYDIFYQYLDEEVVENK